MDEVITDEQKKDEAYARITDANNLMIAARKCLQGVTWKFSAQNYYLHRIDRIRVTKERLESMDRMSDGFVVFMTVERGKKRTIRSVHINERVVHRCQNDQALIPMVRPKLIYDNYASVKDRGMSQALNRLKCHLQRYYRRNNRNNKGYVLLCDLHSYFASIDHDIVYEKFGELLQNEPKTLYLAMDFVDAFGRRSLGLGSQVSQTTAIFYPNKIDHYIKEQLKIKGYGRYMDDFFLIHESKEYLQECLVKIRQMYAEIGIELSERKTQIRRIDKEFKFLKIKIKLTETGKVVMRPDHYAVVRERKKLKRFQQKLEGGEMSYDDVLQQYKSWKGSFKYYDTYKSLKNLDNLFDQLFIKEWRNYSNGKERRHIDEYKEHRFRKRQNPACRRHGLELQSEWE